MQEAEEQKEKEAEPVGAPEESTKKKKVKVSEEELRALKEKVAQAEALYDKYIRLQAEFENVRKRHSREKEEYIRFAHGSMTQELLSVYDHFMIALSNIRTSAGGPGNHTAILQGIQMIQKELWELLSRNGVSKVETLDRTFDPEQHEAVAVTEDEQLPEGTVVEEIRPGYFLNGKLLRPAAVKISEKKQKTDF
ncbi:MAG: nucleotide exchange factor GrpE [Candidatus Omnitrophota bacterium]